MFYRFAGLILLRVFCDTILCSAQPSFLCFLRSTGASVLGCAVFLRSASVITAIRFPSKIRQTKAQSQDVVHPHQPQPVD